VERDVKMGDSRRIHLSRLHFPVTTLGIGRRIGIWLQGCSIRCPGCISADTWAFGTGATSVEEVLSAIACWLPDSDGVTISGGEPFDQPAALEALLRGVRATLPAQRDVLVYSGHPWEGLAPTVQAWRGLIDVLISDPYDADASHTLAWRGSDNQRMHLLTELGRERYGGWQSAKQADAGARLDVAMLEDEVWLAGIPETGTLAALQAQLGAAGFTAKSSEAAARPLPAIFA
jgi:anaerobic ribonucleoside-triphosphate reductase activating protein